MKEKLRILEREETLRGKDYKGLDINYLTIRYLVEDKEDVSDSEFDDYNKNFLDDLNKLIEVSCTVENDSCVLWQMTFPREELGAILNSAYSIRRVVNDDGIERFRFRRYLYGEEDIKVENMFDCLDDLKNFIENNKESIRSFH